jgi:hypothetical protein
MMRWFGWSLDYQQNFTLSAFWKSQFGQAVMVETSLGAAESQQRQANLGIVQPALSYIPCS